MSTLGNVLLGSRVFLDALASPKKTPGLQNTVSVSLLGPELTLGACRRNTATQSLQHNPRGGGGSEAKFAQRPISEYMEEPLMETKALGSTSTLRTQGASPW